MPVISTRCVPSPDAPEGEVIHREAKALAQTEAELAPGDMLGLLTTTGQINFRPSIDLQRIQRAADGIVGAQAFPAIAGSDDVLHLTDARRAKGRFACGAFGVVLGLEILRKAALDPIGAGEAAVAVLQFPILLLGGVVLLRRPSD